MQMKFLWFLVILAASITHSNLILTRDIDLLKVLSGVRVTIKQTSRPTIRNPNAGRLVWSGEAERLGDIVKPSEIKHCGAHYFARWCRGKSVAVLSADLVGKYYHLSHPVSLTLDGEIPAVCKQYEFSHFISYDETDSDMHVTPGIAGSSYTVTGGVRRFGLPDGLTFDQRAQPLLDEYEEERAGIKAILTDCKINWRALAN